MKILCTFPGRSGDLLWALPTVRAIAEHVGEKVDLLIAGEFASMIPLLGLQPYIGEVCALDTWNMSGGWDPGLADVTPWDRAFHLGYRGWPGMPLPREIHTNLAQHSWQDRDGPVPALDLTRPWLTVDGPGSPCDVAVGFTEAWFELKFGLLASVDHQLQFGPTLLQLTPAGSRWTKECAGLTAVEACGWLHAARTIRNSDLFFGDCSALHVLAVGLGVPTVVCEPMEARHNAIFYPLGTVGPQVTLVLGGDGQPTFDARHCADLIRERLAQDRQVREVLGGR